MPLYTGRSSDGSDMREVRGLYGSPDGTTWSARPITEQQRAEEVILDYMEKKNLDLADLYIEIQLKRSKLNARHRRYVIHLVENNVE